MLNAAIDELESWDEMGRESKNRVRSEGRILGYFSAFLL